MSELLLGGRVQVVRGAIEGARAAAIFAELLRETPWQEIWLESAGRTGRLPRWLVNYGERAYDHSGLRFELYAYTPLLLELKALAEGLAGEVSNALLVQLYRDGEQWLDWHADDSPLVGTDPVIVSLSFGAARRFLLRPRSGEGERLELVLGSGDALVLRGDLQRTYVHKVPREPDVRAPRIHLGFGAIRGAAEEALVRHTSVRVRWPEE